MRKKVGNVKMTIFRNEEKLLRIHFNLMKYEYKIRLNRCTMGLSIRPSSVQSYLSDTDLVLKTNFPVFVDDANMFHNPTL